MQSILRRRSAFSSSMKTSVRCYLDWPFLSEEHVMIAKTCRDFTNTELVPIAGKLDKEHKFPAEQIKKLGEMGMMGVCVDPQYGGSGMDTVSYAIAMEEIARGCASTAVIMSGNNSLFCFPVEKYGNEEQKKTYLTDW
jgi:butyryl-CoA dehydrogenase